MKLRTLLSLIFSLLVTSFPAMSDLSSPKNAVVSCQTQILLKGNVKNFLWYGKDTWEGITELPCQNLHTGQIEMKTIKVSVVSFDKGHGYDESYVLKLKLAFAQDFDHVGRPILYTMSEKAAGQALKWFDVSEDGSYEQLFAQVISLDARVPRSVFQNGRIRIDFVK